MEKLLEAVNKNLHKISRILVVICVAGSAIIGILEGGVHLSLLLIGECLFFSILVGGGAYFALWAQYKSPSHNTAVLNVFNIFFIIFFVFFAVVFTIMVAITDLGLSQWFMYVIAILSGMLSVIAFRYKYIKADKNI